MSAVFKPPRLSTALREMQPQAEQRFHDEGKLQPAATHKEYLSVCLEGVGHGECCEGKQICTTGSPVLTADLGWRFTPKLHALLEVVLT